MTSMPKSYFAIDDLKIEADSQTVLMYIVAIRRALVQLRERGEYDTWVGVSGTIDVSDDGDIVDTARHSQVVRLRIDSAVNYQIVEDEFSSSHFDSGHIGATGRAFIEEFFTDTEEATASGE